MPRKLPWLDGASKKETRKSTPAPRAPKKRSSSTDRLVNSDLEDLDPAPRNERPKKRRQREPSSSPPPMIAPEISYMREGLTADDIYVMVEDEFYSTAQLFTAPLHRAAYDRLKRLHRSRGAEALANIERGTDQNTKVGTALRRKMEAKERRGKAVEEESDDDDEYMAVPELAGLMTSSQMIGERRVEGVAKARSNTRAAAGFLQSPHKGSKTKDVFANKNLASAEEDESTDEDDLDAGTTKSRAYEDMDTSLDEPRLSIEKPQEAKSKTHGFFKQFANKPDPPAARPAEPSKKSDPPRHDNTSPSRESSSTPAVNGGPRRGGGGKGSRMAEMLAKRKQQSTQVSDPPLVAVQETPVKTKTKTKKPEPASTPRPKGNSLTSSSIKAEESKSPDYLTQRKIKREKKEAEEKSRKTQRDDIPTFLF
ncbi:hypothetical protein M409DRAFT_24695 [Zasmidium cellare ATCC 36951]|uniref:Uncharacterized protein n=1 Tax=Zasmidium cellare ATCC 36951 TaxID=1080233 RepID=A0A6A6CEW4_ZASCE|nr:uncharacterized protein M409DRAFT_24695 [Zasmidium cellare ATCC 36951]KAF2164790.1 hypothetical protein M409DRAFT_24695 [Zasmidium cellare ATCC 36951]